jgi:hypothetical protein
LRCISQWLGNRVPDGVTQIPDELLDSMDHKGATVARVCDSIDEECDDLCALGAQGTFWELATEGPDTESDMVWP